MLDLPFCWAIINSIVIFLFKINKTEIDSLGEFIKSHDKMVISLKV